MASFKFEQSKHIRENDKIINRYNDFSIVLFKMKPEKSLENLEKHTRTNAVLEKRNHNRKFQWNCIIVSNHMPNDECSILESTIQNYYFGKQCKVLLFHLATNRMGSRHLHLVLNLNCDSEWEWEWESGITFTLSNLLENTRALHTLISGTWILFLVSIAHFLFSPNTHKGCKWWFRLKCKIYWIFYAIKWICYLKISILARPIGAKVTKKIIIVTEPNSDSWFELFQQFQIILIFIINCEFIKFTKLFVFLVKICTENSISGCLLLQALYNCARTCQHHACLQQ